VCRVRVHRPEEGLGDRDAAKRRAALQDQGVTLERGHRQYKGPEPELEVLGHLVRRADGIELKP
jgi:hypothetical protein